MYEYEITQKLRDVLLQISKKDKQLYEQILRKIEEIITSSNFEHYKNLRYKLKEFKRVHIGHFVLIFKLDQENQIIRFHDFQHHDFIYKK
jgi:YafQ family addiction module toxin component